MKNKKNLVWAIPLLGIVLGTLLILCCFILPTGNIRSVCADFAIELILTSFVVGVVANATFFVVVLLRKILKKDYPLKQGINRILASVFAFMFIGALAFNTHYHVAVMLMLGQDPIFEIFQDGDIEKLNIPYDEEWMIDKSRDQIVERYGEHSPYGYVIYSYGGIDITTWYLGLRYDENGICTGTYRIDSIPGG